jgi:hypothetical protein
MSILCISDLYGHQWRRKKSFSPPPCPWQIGGKTKSHDFTKSTLHYDVFDREWCQGHKTFFLAANDEAKWATVTAKSYQPGQISQLWQALGLTRKHQTRLEMLALKAQRKYNIDTSSPCYKICFVRSLRIFARRYSFSPRQAFPVHSNKHSSLVRKFINYGQKSFITLAPV